MKRLINTFLVILAMLVTPAITQAQTLPGCLELETLSAGTGKSALSNGLWAAADFSSCTNKTYAQVMIQEQQGWLILARKFQGGPFNATVGWSVGHFQGAPDYGPYFDTGFQVADGIKVTGMYWPAGFGWEPDDWKNDGKVNHESMLIGHFGMMGLELGKTYKVRFEYIGLDFLDDPTNWMEGVALSGPIAPSYKLMVSATWNENVEIWMLNLGFSKSMK